MRLSVLSFGETLNRAFALYIGHLPALLGLALITAGLPLVAVSIAAQPLQNDTWAQALFAGPRLAMLIQVCVTQVAFFMGGSVASFLVARGYLGGRVRLWEAMRASLARLPVLLSALACWMPIALAYASLGIILSGAAQTSSKADTAMLAILALIFVVVPLGTWILMRYGLAYCAARLEDAPGWHALKRSAQLVRGGWWAFFGLNFVIQLAGYALMLGVNMATAMLDSFPGLELMSLFAWPAIIALTMPLSWTVSTLFYFSQRCEKEHLDLVILAEGFSAGARASDGATPQSKAGSIEWPPPALAQGYVPANEGQHL